MRSELTCMAPMALRLEFTAPPPFLFTMYFTISWQHTPTDRLIETTTKCQLSYVGWQHTLTDRPITSNLLAHVELGTCPACRLEIVDEITDPESQILRAQPGDKPPPVPEQYNGTSWSVLHSCQNYGEKVLFRIPVTQWAVCILHMNLRITGMMFERTVLRNLMKDPRSKSKTDAKTSSSNSRASHLYDLLLALRIPCKLFSCPKNSVGKFYNSISKHSFAGNDSAKCISAYESILKVKEPLVHYRVY